ncbi:MAG: hypothetical protein ACLFV2_02540 [Desulfurivibrionaceae bacterium]
MKIEQLINQAITSQQNGQNRDQKSVSGSDFQAILKNQLQEASASTATESSQEVNEAPFNPELRLQSLSTSEAAVDTLDSYKDALSNLHLKGSQLEGYIEDLEQKTLALHTLKEDLPSGDPLEKLVDQVAALSYVEAAKYRRGDYL